MENLRNRNRNMKSGCFRTVSRAKAYDYIVTLLSNSHKIEQNVEREERSEIQP